MNDAELRVGLRQCTCAGVYIRAPSVRNPLSVWPSLKWASLPGPAQPLTHQKGNKATAAVPA